MTDLWFTDHSWTRGNVAYQAAIARNKVIAQDSAPTDPSYGDLWIDTLHSNIIKIWTSGSPDAWVVYSDKSKNKTTTNDLKPDITTAIVGDIWINTSGGTNVFEVFNGTDFVAYQDAGISAAYNLASAKNKVLAQTSTPTSAAIGDLWIDTTNGLNIVKICTALGPPLVFTPYQDATKNKVSTGTSAPTGAIKGDLWIDTTINVVKVYDGAGNWPAYQDAAIPVLQTGKNKVVAQGSAPTTAALGDLWIDTTNNLNIVKVCTSLGPPLVFSPYQDATKNRVTAAPTAPTVPTPIIGDLWINTADNIVRVYDGTTPWKPYQDAAIPQLQQVKTTTYYQPSQPPTTSRVIGDLWIDTGNGNRIFTWNTSPSSQWWPTQFQSQALNISIGGGNLLGNSSYEATVNAAGEANPYSSNNEISGYFACPVAIDTTHQFTGTRCLKWTTNSTTNPQGGIHISPVTLKAGTKVVSSVWLRCDTGTVQLMVGGRATRPGTYVTLSDGNNQFTATVTTSWQRFVVPSWTYAGEDFLPGVQFRLATNASGVIFYSDAAQIEVGDVATAWAPRPDEILPGSVGTTQVNFNARSIGGLNTYIQPSMPTGTAYQVGDLWMDATASTGQMHQWNGANWSSIVWSDPSLAAAANNALNTAQAKAKITVGGTAPATAALNDMWIDQGNGNLLKICTAVGPPPTFTPYQDTTIGMKTTVFYQPSPPSTTGRSNGDLWINSSTMQTWRWAGSWIVTDLASQSYVISRGTDLVTNGTGLLGNNYNFSAFTFTGADAPIGGGSFISTYGTSGAFITDELIPVDLVKKYQLTYSLRQTTAANTTGCAYGFLAPYDSGKNSILPNYYMQQANTATTLSAALNPGDTVIHLTSAANWNNAAGANTFQRSIIIYNYTDAAGKTWPANSYSRNSYSNVYADGGVNTSTNTITLSAPWAGVAAAAGTAVANATSGGNYMYGGASNTLIPTTWTSYTAQYYGQHTNLQSQATSAFPPGTAYVKVGWLLNRLSAGGQDGTSQHAAAAVSLSDASAAAVNLTTKNTTYSQSSMPTGGTYKLADIWVNSTNGLVSYYNGTTFVAAPVDAGALASSLVLSTRVVAGSPTGTHAEMATDGFHVYKADPNTPSNPPIEVARMGVASTNDYFAIVDPVGNTLASVTDDGTVNGTGANFDGLFDNNGDGIPDYGVTIYGLDFSDHIADLPQGILAYGIRNTRLAAYTTTEAPFQELQTTMYPNRMYRVMTGPLTVQCNTAGGQAITRLRYTTDGTTPGITSALGSTSNAVTCTTAAAWYGSPGLARYFSVTTTTDFRALLTVGPGSSSYAVNLIGNDGTGGMSMWIEDCGPAIGDTGIDRTGGTPPPLKKTYVSVWQASATEGYQGGGGVRGDTTDMVQGPDPSGFNGNGWGSAVFANANSTGSEINKNITTALTGATVQKIEVYLYANHWYYNAGGTARIRNSNSTNLINTAPAGSFIDVKGWAANTGRWVDITSIASSATRGVTLGQGPSSSDYNYYGRFNGNLTGSGVAALRITYVK